MLREYCKWSRGNEEIFEMNITQYAFSYKDAKNWGKKYHECNGPNQSPISFAPSSGPEGYPEIKEEMRLTDFNTSPKKMSIKNTGHTVEIKADWNGKRPSCTGGPLHGNYVFEKATFHWAKKPTGFPNTKHWLDDFSETLHKIRSPNSTAEIKPFPLLNDFDNAYTSFLFYEGSLDYPPCSESVTWFIVEYPIHVIDSVLNEFKKIKLSEGDVSNVRPTQPLNKRELKYVYNHNRH
ncbi:carbonic anhydrase 7-like [Belonocnema kinseyi]|uniref:carbonic anhydrase 7-like n=1 Tax=Belonocnema kinseyi TaxID=2817044 RepID=UPI00143D08CE|nr:carbonic anhydrase 7-like [Belonocnema kinseyi]